jgi:hypothetical protein
VGASTPLNVIVYALVLPVLFLNSFHIRSLYLTLEYHYSVSGQRGFRSLLGPHLNNSAEHEWQYVGLLSTSVNAAHIIGDVGPYREPKVGESVQVHYKRLKYS